MADHLQNANYNFLMRMANIKAGQRPDHRQDSHEYRERNAEARQSDKERAQSHRICTVWAETSLDS